MLTNKEYLLHNALERIAEDRAVYVPELQRIAREAIAEAAKPTRDEENAASLANTGKCSYESIAEMVAALNCDYDRYQELIDLAGTGELSNDECGEYDALKKAAGDCKDRDDAEQRIHEDPLSVEVRSDWLEIGSFAREPRMQPAEFRILLATGGPAVRIIGELDANCEPTSARLQAQDWFLPWTDYRDADESVLLDYCRCFYFGEG